MLQSRKVSAARGLMLIPETSLSQIRTLDGVVSHVHRALGVSVVLITQPLETIQRVIASAGQPLPEGFRESFPIVYSICRHVTEMNFELVIDDAFSHPLLHDHPAVAKLGVAAYLGVPIKRADSSGEGSGYVLCALHNHQRKWSPEEIELMHKAARRLTELGDALF